MLRTIISMGIDRFEKEELSTLINGGAEIDIRFIAQKHDLGMDVSIEEIDYLLQTVNHFFQIKMLPHFETITTLSHAFTAVIRSRCFKISDSILNLLKGEEFTEKGDICPLQPFASFQAFEERCLALETKVSNLANYTRNTSEVLQIVRSMVSVLAFLSAHRDTSLLDLREFKKAINPHIFLFIKIAKGGLNAHLKCQTVHCCTPFLLFQENKLKSFYEVETERYKFLLKISASLETKGLISLKQKGVSFSIDFYEFEELLNIISLFSPEKSPPLICEGSKLTVLRLEEPKGSSKIKLLLHSNCFEFFWGEWEEFANFCKENEKELALPLSILRYQLGSY